MPQATDDGESVGDQAITEGERSEPGEGDRPVGLPLGAIFTGKGRLCKVDAIGRLTRSIKIASE